MVNIVVRQFPEPAYAALHAHGLSPVLARVLAARGIEDPVELDTALARVTSFTCLKNSQRIAQLLADAIAIRKKLLIVADYDADGATACAVALLALHQFGAAGITAHPQRTVLRRYPRITPGSEMRPSTHYDL